MKTYTTIQGDTWDLISYKVYNNEKNMNVLMEANPKYIPVVIFPAGITLKVPEIEPINITIKPPWMR